MPNTVFMMIFSRMYALYFGAILSLLLLPLPACPPSL